MFADLDARSDVDAIYHLGDLVGYAPWPDEVVQLLKERAIPGIAGNYDSTTASDDKHCGRMYEDARQEELSHLSYEWTRAHASPETKRYLGSNFELAIAVVADERATKRSTLPWRRLPGMAAPLPQPGAQMWRARRRTRPRPL